MIDCVCFSSFGTSADNKTQKCRKKGDMTCIKVFQWNLLAEH